MRASAHSTSPRLRGEVEARQSSRLLRLRMQQHLLYAPIGGFGHVDFVLRRARERMGAGELLEVASRAADHAKHLAIEGQLEDPPPQCGFAAEHQPVRAGPYSQPIWRPH